METFLYSTSGFLSLVLEKSSLKLSQLLRIPATVGVIVSNLPIHSHLNAPRRDGGAESQDLRSYPRIRLRWHSGAYRPRCTTRSADCWRTSRWLDHGRYALHAHLTQTCFQLLSGYSPNGAFSEYFVTRADFVVPIPESWSFEEAAQLGICPYTALQALYESLEGLPTPDCPTTDNEPILIYGASTAVGLFAMQFAKLAGLRVLATASPANFELVKKFGADDVFDYRDPGVVKEIKNATGGKLTTAVDCVATEQTISLVIGAISEEGGQVATVLPVESTRENVRVKFSLIFEW